MSKNSIKIQQSKSEKKQSAQSSVKPSSSQLQSVTASTVSSTQCVVAKPTVVSPQVQPVAASSTVNLTQCTVAKPTVVSPQVQPVAASIVNSTQCTVAKPTVVSPQVQPVAASSTVNLTQCTVAKPTVVSPQVQPVAASSTVNLTQCIIAKPPDVSTVPEPAQENVSQFPIERERNFRRKVGYVDDSYDYLLVNIEVQRGKKFGLGIIHTENHVLVNRVDENRKLSILLKTSIEIADSMCTGSLQYLDRICDVEGIPVTDKEFCIRQIIKSLKSSGKVSLAIERPLSEDKKMKVEHLLTMTHKQPPSVVLEADVKAILTKYNAKLKTGNIKNAQSALGKKGPRKPVQVLVNENLEMVNIGMDNEMLQDQLQVNGFHICNPHKIKFEMILVVTVTHTALGMILTM
ncbi:hypothetical protein DICVIV_10432 [Dictyocaulus viviparus]|uniref:PDZ domain-containing protein n=1 Tax=Dictyocaulus viviparus TaxID=29172 RepID=A0A0D8XFT6_DICVI|nr:hypothetical protein DICVIV_10432 [Dictyocaulus viviparus]